MKKLILILFLLLPLSAFGLSFGCGEPEPVKYTLIDPVAGIDFVFELHNSEIRQVGVINYYTYEIIHLKKSLGVKSKQTAGSDKDAPDQRRKMLDDMIRETWPNVGRVKYFKQE